MPLARRAESAVFARRKKVRVKKPLAVGRASLTSKSSHHTHRSEIYALVQVWRSSSRCAHEAVLLATPKDRPTMEYVQGVLCDNLEDEKNSSTSASQS